MAGQKKIQPDKVLPHFFPTKLLEYNPIPATELFNRFHFSHKNFAQFATAEELEKFKPHLLEIDIHQELHLMNEENALEITVPVMGITDLLSKEENFCQSLSFPTIVAINGFGASIEAAHFARAEFVVITDIIGNRYEVLVSENGKIELPQEGIGLFSIPKSITFIFSSQQIKGKWLENLEEKGINAGKIYLIPPTEIKNNFKCNIFVTHLNELNRRMVDSIRTVKIHSRPVKMDNSQKVSMVQRFTHDTKDMLYVDISLRLDSIQFCEPFSACVTLEKLDKIEYGFTHPLLPYVTAESNNWMQHPIFSNVYTKHFGLSDNALTLLVKEIYSENDFLKNYLKGDVYNLSQKNGYNNFLLQPEAFGKFYDLLIQDIVNRKSDGNFLFDRVPEEKLANIDITDFAVDFHDSIVLAQLMAECRSYRFDNLYQLLQPQIHLGIIELPEYFYIYAPGIGDVLPHVTVEIMPATILSQNILSYIEGLSFDKSQMVQQNIFEENQLISPVKEQTIENFLHFDEKDFAKYEQKLSNTIHLGEVMDFNQLKMLDSHIILNKELPETLSVNLKMMQVDTPKEFKIPTWQPTLEVSIDPSHISIPAHPTRRLTSS